MNGARARAWVWTLLAVGVAMIVLSTWAYQRFGLSWFMIALTVIAAGCIAAMVYLWWLSDQTTETLDKLAGARKPARPKGKQ